MFEKPSRPSGFVRPGLANFEIVDDDAQWQGLTAAGSGTSHLSHEELARNEHFYHVKRSGELTFMGKQPDIRTREGAVLAHHKLTGQTRVVNNYFPNLGDAAVLERYSPALAQAMPPARFSDAMLQKWGPTIENLRRQAAAMRSSQAVMRTGASQAMAQVGTGSVSRTVRGARRMLQSL